MVSMAYSITFGAESTCHPSIGTAASSSGCCGGGLLSCSALSSISLPQRVLGGRRRTKCSAGKVDFLSDCPFRCSTSKLPASPRRAHCSAELKTFRTLELDDENVDDESVFRPPLGWPFCSGTAADLHFIGTKKNARVSVPDPPVSLERQDEKFEVSNLFDGIVTRPSENLYHHWIATEFSAAVQSGSPPPKQKQENSEQDSYYVNTGYAIRSLREELPNMFYKKLNFDIYRDDITFRDPMNVISGIDNYKLIFWALRFHGRIFFRAIWVDIGRVWQPEDKIIMVRWTVRGIPRVPWEAQGQFDGTSEYKLDAAGKIYEHKVDNVIFNSPPTHKYKAISVMDLVRVAGGQTTPTPSFYDKSVTLFLLLFPTFSSSRGCASIGL